MTMKRILSIITLALIAAATLTLGEVIPQAKAEENNASYFTKESFTLGSITLPYRKAEINADRSEMPALVMYLHGGTSRGSDNEAQLLEVAVDSIYNYLSEHDIRATFIVPQCPANGGWTSQNRKVVHDLLANLIDGGQADADRVYVMGGSMGGTGTWCQLSYFPNFYAAAMPVAGSPKDLVAANVAATPVYTVMGTADNIMSIPDVEAFKTEVETAGGLVTLDIEDGWTHANTCEWSYTAERLAWLFAQRKSEETGITSHPANSTANHSGMFTLSGIRLSEPPAKGFCIENGKKIIRIKNMDASAAGAYYRHL